MHARMMHPAGHWKDPVPISASEYSTVTLQKWPVAELVACHFNS